MANTSWKEIVTGGVPTLLHSLTVANVITNLGGEQTLASFSISAAKLQAGAVIRIEAGGFYNFSGGAASIFKSKVQLAGIAVDTMSTNMGTNFGSWWWESEWIVRTEGAGGTMEGRATYGFNEGAAASDFGNSIGGDSLDTTADALAAMIGEMTVTDPNNNYSIQSFNVWLYPPP